MYKIKKIKLQTYSEKLYTIDGKEVTPSKCVWVIYKTYCIFGRTYIRFEDPIEKVLAKANTVAAWGPMFNFNFTNKLGATEFQTKGGAQKMVELMKKHPSYFITKTTLK